jgi:thiol-disulfide isomerase/thioredoxin
MLLLWVAGCSYGASTSGTDGQDFIAGDGSSQIIEVDKRLTAPDISGVTLDGEKLALADFAGTVVVINVWGSWCSPCRAEAPILQEVYSETRKRGVAFLGLNTRDQEAAAIAFEDSFGITYPSLVDETGELQLAFRQFLPSNAIPSTLIIDRDGLVAARILGATTYSQLTDLVDQVAAER